MKKIGMIQPTGLPMMTIYYDDKAKTNPYRVYKEYYELGECGYGLTKRKKLINKYGNLYSCICEMNKYIAENDEEKR